MSNALPVLAQALGDLLTVSAETLVAIWLSAKGEEHTIWCAAIAVKLDPGFRAL